MVEMSGYAVYLFPGAMETLGDAIKPYLVDGPGGPHLVCTEVDTGGALVEMTILAQDRDGRRVDLELMVPVNMVKMIVTTRSEEAFGFGPRAETSLPTLPPVGPTGAPADAPTEALPHTATTPEDKPTPDDKPTPTPPKP